jgi:hypothetical protein
VSLQFPDNKRLRAMVGFVDVATERQELVAEPFAPSAVLANPAADLQPRQQNLPLAERGQIAR